MPPALILRRSRLLTQLNAQQAKSAGPLTIVTGGLKANILTLRTRGGLSGYGECKNASGADLDTALAYLQGRSATSYEVAHAALKLNPISAAVNMALLDITGQIAKAPIYQVLGGPTRYKARALATLNPSGPLESMKDLHAEGYRAFRLPISQGATEVADLVRQLRSQGGEGVDFVLDGAGRYKPGQAGRIAAAVQSSHPLWLDEICEPNNVKALEKIADETTVPLGFGRNIAQIGQFQELLREQVIDVLRPDVAVLGISGARRAALLAEPYYTAIAPYTSGGKLAVYAALHLAASVPNFFLLDVPAGILKVSNGFVDLPTKPGLGTQPEAQ